MCNISCVNRISEQNLVCFNEISRKICIVHNTIGSRASHFTDVNRKKTTKDLCAILISFYMHCEDFEPLWNFRFFAAFSGKLWSHCGINCFNGLCWIQQVLPSVEARVFKGLRFHQKYGQFNYSSCVFFTFLAFNIYFYRFRDVCSAHFTLFAVMCKKCTSYYSWNISFKVFSLSS